jgi:hypothetical protein
MIVRPDGASRLNGTPDFTRVPILRLALRLLGNIVSRLSLMVQACIVSAFGVDLIVTAGLDAFSGQPTLAGEPE